MKTDEQFESARRLEEYRIKTEKSPEPIHLEDFVELNTLPKCHAMFLRQPEKKKVVLK